MVVLFGLAVLSGAIAAVAGFGIGSILTPFLALSAGTPLAVAAVALPHALATALRLVMLWRHLDRQVLLRFGLASAAGALAGALLQPAFGARGLTIILGGLLVLTAIATTGLLERREVPRGPAFLLGGLSGLFGGLVGNQGGVRSGALLAFQLEPRAFVATATGAALLVDFARVPVYLARAWSALAPLVAEIGVMSAGVLVGTVFGDRILGGLPRALFRRVVAAAVGAIGVWLVASSL